MLVLSRKVGQSVVIGDVTVTLLRKKGRIRLGIEAPAGIHIMRPEANARTQGCWAKANFCRLNLPTHHPPAGCRDYDRPAASGALGAML